MTSTGSYGTVPAARPRRLSWAAVSEEPSSTGAVHACARRQLVVSCAPNSHDPVGMSVKVLERPVERPVTAVADFGIYGKYMNGEIRGADDEKNPHLKFSGIIFRNDDRLGASFGGS